MVNNARQELYLDYAKERDAAIATQHEGILAEQIAKENFVNGLKKLGEFVPHHLRTEK